MHTLCVTVVGTVHGILCVTYNTGLPRVHVQVYHSSASACAGVLVHSRVTSTHE